jgi:hypothetical protein
VTKKEREDAWIAMGRADARITQLFEHWVGQMLVEPTEYRQGLVAGYLDLFAEHPPEQWKDQK